MPEVLLRQSLSQTFKAGPGDKNNRGAIDDPFRRCLFPTPRGNETNFEFDQNEPGGRIVLGRNSSFFPQGAYSIAIRTRPGKIRIDSSVQSW